MKVTQAMINAAAAQHWNRFSRGIAGMAFEDVGEDSMFKRDSLHTAREMLEAAMEAAEVPEPIAPVVTEEILGVAREVYVHHRAKC